MSKTQIKSLKTQVLNLKDSLRWTEKQSHAYKNYSEDLRFKLDEALNRLQMIATNYAYQLEVNATDDAAARAKVTASMGLKKIARMQERKA
jgi:hypothetical protein